MDTQLVLQTGLDLIQPWVVETRTPEPNRLDAILLSANLYAAVSTLIKARWGYLSAITGLDTLNPVVVPPTAVEGSNDPQGALEALYHFCQGAAILTLRISIPRENPIIPSICGVLPSASLYERELMELFGIEIIGTPNTDRLLLSDDWPVGVYPMRKDFTGFDTTIDKKPEPKPTTEAK
jgi:NADH:ubiquinone oxidoreductase subunit C